MPDAAWRSPVNTWDQLRKQQLDRQAIAQVNTLAPKIDNELHAYLLEHASEVADLVASKQADYGPDAIVNAPGGVLNGINVRLHDKLSRAAHLSGKTHPSFAQHESVLDTYRDIAGYALIALLVLDGKW